MVISDTETSVGEWLGLVNVRISLIIIVIILLSFIAIKEALSLWLLVKLDLNKPSSKKEHLSVCPPGKSQNIVGMCR